MKSLFIKECLMANDSQGLSAYSSPSPGFLTKQGTARGTVVWLEVHDNGKSNAHTSFQGFSDSHVTKVLKRQS